MEESAMKRLTIDDVLSLNPCQPAYSRSALLRLSKGRKGLTLLEILALRIPPDDKVWLMTRPGVLTAEQDQAWKVIVCTRAIKKYALQCGVASVESWAQDWLANRDRTPARAAEAARAARAAWAAGAAETRQQILDLRKILERETP